MQFRDLNKQYKKLRQQLDLSIFTTIEEGNFICGSQVQELEEQLANYVGVKHCITCGNGTDALSLALKVWGIGEGDAVFVPDFTFFASGEVVCDIGATPIFVDVQEETFNLCYQSLELAIQAVIKEGKLIPKVIITVDLFGQPANYPKIKEIGEKYGLFILEDAAQGFGGEINSRKACNFGDIATTSFFPAKPLGCYGDGGAIFTNYDEVAQLIRSYCVHGKGENKYDNIRIGRNSRLDTIQAAILQVKLEAFKQYELEAVNEVANSYTEHLNGIVRTPIILNNYYSSWAQYTIQLANREERDKLQQFLKENRIPTMIYYPKPMHLQQAFEEITCKLVDLSVTERLCNTVLSLPIHPYLLKKEIEFIVRTIKQYIS